MTTKLPLLLALPALGLGLAACGDQTKEVEKSVVDILGERGYPDAKADCPESVDVKKGTTFDCSVTGGDIKKVTIRINDDNGDDLEVVKFE